MRRNVRRLAAMEEKAKVRELFDEPWRRVPQEVWDAEARLGPAIDVALEEIAFCGFRRSQLARHGVSEEEMQRLAPFPGLPNYPEYESDLALRRKWSEELGRDLTPKPISDAEANAELIKALHRRRLRASGQLSDELEE